MKSLTALLLGSVASLTVVDRVSAADLPAIKAIPIEYVRICNTYGAGYFYIPGTETCLRLSGRARYEGAYAPSAARQAASNSGDSVVYQTRARINLDARTQTSYGTLRAFVRVEVGNRTGLISGTTNRIGNSFSATGTDQAGRVQQYVNTDKAFIQFAGLTAGRASSFFDFYAHDFEFIGASVGSDISSTNLLAYTLTSGTGFSATVSIEDPSFRRTPIYAPIVSSGVAPNVGATFQASPVFVGYDGVTPTRYNVVDAVERNRLPDFVGMLRYDGTWGSAQISAAGHQLNVGNISSAAPLGAGGVPTDLRHSNSTMGYAVQGGVKVNMPFIAAGDTLYLQGAYGVGAQLYTGYSAYTGSYGQSVNLFEGQKFQQYFSDATINPVSGQLEKSESFTAVVSFLHYWTPEWRSAAFASYGEQSFSKQARLAQGSVFNLVNPAGTNTFAASAVGTPGTPFYKISAALRDTYQFTGGGSLIWSPVKDLDIGVEAVYSRIGAKSGRVIDVDKDPGAYSGARIASINAGGPVRTATRDSFTQVRFRVQRDF